MYQSPDQVFTLIHPSTLPPSPSFWTIAQNMFYILSFLIVIISPFVIFHNYFKNFQAKPIHWAKLLNLAFTSLLFTRKLIYEKNFFLLIIYPPDKGIKLVKQWEVQKIAFSSEIKE
jgi:hypothetical protein